jgi:cytosine/adenosine deaminase-related metal-dependent hydrolase
MLRRRLAARWILPVGRVAIEHGALLIGPTGRIEAVGADAAVPAGKNIPAEKFDHGVILPGLINTHTHLELTGFEGKVPERDFAAWIRHLRELKATRSAADYLDAARRGVEACYAAGITTVADTGDSGAAIQALSDCGGSGIAYQEVFGPDPEQAEDSLAELRTKVERARLLPGKRLRVGVSPHAPYTVSGPLFRSVAAWARAEKLPLAVHIAESPAESQFVLKGRGPFADAWRARGIPLPKSQGFTPVAWLARHDVLSGQTLCIHAVQLSKEDIVCLARSGAAVAHCPRSNRKHGHGDAQLQSLLDRGIRVGLGTDSVVSVGTVDMFAEARMAASIAPSLAPEALLELCTIAGARALGLDDETGTLEPGKWADCTVIRLPAEAGGNPTERVLASKPADVLCTYLGGREVYRTV